VVEGYRRRRRLAQQPDSVVEELTGRLNRGLGGAAEIPF
jgi:hypothetical protein